MAQWRCKEIQSLLRDIVPFPDSACNIKIEKGCDFDWHGLSERVDYDHTMRYRFDVLDIIKKGEENVKKSVEGGDNRLPLLRQLRQGRPWEYMGKTHIPELSLSKVTIRYEEETNANSNKIDSTPKIIEDARLKEYRYPLYWSIPGTECYPSINTNLLYDAVGIPNLGITIGNGSWSASASWMYGWWKATGPRFVHAFGGEFSLSRWWGAASKVRPHSGHHIGAFAQMLALDFKLWPRKGYYAPRWTRGVGLEYGYSMPIGANFNLDFTIGVGYMEGSVDRYEHIDDCDVWQETKKRQFIGPIKAGVTLIWIPGRGGKVSSETKKGGEL